MRKGDLAGSRIPKHAIRLVPEKVELLREKLRDAGFEIIFNGVYVHDKRASSQHLHGFNVWKPYAILDLDENFFILNGVDENQKRLLGVYQSV